MSVTAKDRATTPQTSKVMMVCKLKKGLLVRTGLPSNMVF
ncbi:hypothetical protein UF75_4292 [Desulfosporosinus sp. I2]|nr:hypothetical protein UF75_4292 [Desulfosporosinus sp. I2]